MRYARPLFERGRTERHGDAAVFTFEQWHANRIDFRSTLLLPPNQIADDFAVIGVVSGINLCLDPTLRARSPTAGANS